MTKIILSFVLVFALSACGGETIEYDSEFFVENDLDIDINDYVSIGDIGDVTVYRIIDIPEWYYMYGINLSDSTGDECLTGAHNRNFIVEYPDGYHYVSYGLSVDMFTLEELYNIGVLVGCRYPTEELEDHRRIEFNLETALDEEGIYCISYNLKCVPDEEVEFTIDGFDFYRAIDFATCFAFFENIIDGYDFGGTSGCAPSLDELDYIVVKDGYAYSIQQLVDTGHLLTYEIYYRHLYTN